MFTALIADDEPLARVRMRSLLEAYSGEIEILGEASSGAQTIDKIHELDPDVVFLDIQTKTIFRLLFSRRLTITLLCALTKKMSSITS